jgi:hypothetical protein
MAIFLELGKCFKYPKAYVFLHHPSYFLENDPSKPNFLVKGEINNQFSNKGEE